MTQSYDGSFDYLLYGLAYECPYQRRKDNCPLMEIDHMHFREKADWIYHLCEEKKRLIFDFHQDCTKKR